MSGPTADHAVSARRSLTRKTLVRNPSPEPGGARPARVSVVIPCYNYARFLPAAVNSVLAQADVEVEVLVIDDASTDDSAAVAGQLAAADARVRLVRQPGNGGHVAAVNTGIGLATGEFLVRLDADDLLTPGSLARSAGLLRAQPSVGLVYGRPLHFVGEPPPVPGIAVRSWSVWHGLDWVADRCRKGYNCITTPEVMLRASVVRRAGGIDPRLRIAEDMHWWLRIAAIADIGRVDGPYQALHRDHEASITATVDRFEDLRARRLVFQYLFEGGDGGWADNAGALDRSWRRSLAVQALDEASRAFDRRRTDTVDVLGYVQFARETFPDGYRNLLQWRAFQLRRRVGARLMPLTPIAAAAIARRRVTAMAEYRRWERTGL